MPSHCSRGPRSMGRRCPVPARLPELSFREHTMAMVQPHSADVMDDWKGCRRGLPSRQLLQVEFLPPGRTGGFSDSDRPCCAHTPDAAATLYVAPSRSSSRVAGAPANLRVEQSRKKRLRAAEGRTWSVNVLAQGFSGLFGDPCKAHDAGNIWRRCIFLVERPEVRALFRRLVRRQLAQ
jgi:hypothetical protein